MENKKCPICGGADIDCTWDEGYHFSTPATHISAQVAVQAADAVALSPRTAFEIQLMSHSANLTFLLVKEEGLVKALQAKIDILTAEKENILCVMGDTDKIIAGLKEEIERLKEFESMYSGLCK